MCDNCTTLAQYGPALRDVHQRLERVLTTGAHTEDPIAQKLARTFGLVAQVANTETRTPKETVDYIDAMTPDERRAVRDVSAALASLYGANADIVNTAMLAHHDQGAWTDDEDHPPTDLKDILDQFRGDPEGTTTVGQAVLSMPEGGALSGPMQGKVAAVLAEAAKRIAELTGAPVEMQEVVNDRSGRPRMGNRSVTAPGQLPVVMGKGDKLIH